MASEPRPIGVVVAMPAEARGLARRQVPSRHPITLDSGVTVLAGGIGIERAQWAARELVRSGVQGLVSWGTAAGLDASLEPGELLLPECVVGFGTANLAVDRRWHRALGRALNSRFACRGGLLAHAGEVLRGPREKRALLARTSALGADMESAGVATVAQDAGVSFVVVRAVSDGARDSVPRAALCAVSDDGRLEAGRFLAAWLRHPDETPAILRLARGFRRACRTLTGVAETIGPRLGMG